MPTQEKNKKAIIIGSGFGGLSAALRLQGMGFDVTVCEKQDQPGGRAYVHQIEGFTFDAGPTVITAPQCIEETFEASGRNLYDYCSLLPVEPFYQLCWEDGTRFDYGMDLKETLDQIVKIAGDRDAKGYLEFLRYTEKVFVEGYEKLSAVPFLDWWSMIRVSPQLIKLKAYQNVYQSVGRFIENEKMRQAFSFHSLLVGGNPFHTSSIYTLIHFLERKWGVRFPKGGTGSLVKAYVKAIKDNGGDIRVNCEIDEIIVDQGCIRGVRTSDQTLIEADIVVSNADVVHTYDKLLRRATAVSKTRRFLKAKSQSMSLFLIYFGTRKKFKNIKHHMVLFGQRYRELLNDIFEKGHLADDFSLYLHAPTVTDPELAPGGCETFYVLSPVPHLGLAPLDWNKIGPAYADRILSYLEENYLPELKANLAVKKIFTPLDFQANYNAYLGSAFSLEPTLIQSAYFRVHNRDSHLKGLYFVGAGTHPGAGLPGVIQSAKATCGVIAEDYQVKVLAKPRGVVTPSKVNTDIYTDLNV